MTRDEIEEFSGVELNCFETDREEDWYKIGCIDGLEAADAEPNLESLWHDTSEEPHENGWILLQFSTDVYDTLKLPRDVGVWLDFVKMRNFVRWAYISNLLPKGGER